MQAKQLVSSITCSCGWFGIAGTGAFNLDLFEEHAAQDPDNHRVVAASSMSSPAAPDVIGYHLRQAKVMATERRATDFVDHWRHMQMDENRMHTGVRARTLKPYIITLGVLVGLLMAVLIAHADNPPMPRPLTTKPDLTLNVSALRPKAALQMVEDAMREGCFKTANGKDELVMVVEMQQKVGPSKFYRATCHKDGTMSPLGRIADPTGGR